MAKKSVIARQLKREKMVEKFAPLRKELQKKLKSKILTPKERMLILKKQAALPRDSSRTRLRNRCMITGRPRGVYSRFKICRHKIREFMGRGQLPGLEKASW